MNYRINTYAIVALVTLVCVAAGIFVYTLVRTPTDEKPADETPQPSEPVVEEMVINGKRQYVDAMHTIGGMVQVPTPCHSITVEPFFVQTEESTPTVELQFRTVLEGTECPSVASDAPFRVTFEGPEQMNMRATWNGAPARLNLVPVAPGETVDDAFIFKG